MSDAASIARDYLECFNARDWERMRSFLHEDFTYTGPDAQVLQGANAGLAVAQMFASAMPDARLRIERQAVDGDIVMTEFLGSGTQDGDLMGIPPSNRAVSVPVCNILEIRDGKIIAEREYMDMLNVLQQIGAAPAPATA